MEHKLKISVGNLKVELVGSEKFVEEYEKKFSLEEKVKKLADKRAFSENDPPKELPRDGKATNGENGQEENPYPYVFDQSGERTQLLPEIPGKYITTKQENIALLYLLGTELRTSSEAETPTIGEIRDIYYKKCGRPKNMNLKHNLRKRSQYFEIIGEKGIQNSPIKLTMLGKNEAHKLAKRLNDKLSE